MSLPEADAARLRRRSFRLDRLLRPHLRGGTPRRRPQHLAQMVVGRPRRPLIIAALAVKKGIECWESGNEAEQ